MNRIKLFFRDVLPLRTIGRADDRDWMVGLSSLSGCGAGFLIGTRTERGHVSLVVEWWRYR